MKRALAYLSAVDTDVKVVLRLVPSARDRGDDRDRDAGSDEAVFDGGRTDLVAKEAR